MTVEQARETVEGYRRYLGSRPEAWKPEPMPVNVQEALCVLALEG